MLREALVVGCYFPCSALIVLVHNNRFLIADLDAVLGFINTSYQVNEADMNATIQIGRIFEKQSIT